MTYLLLQTFLLLLSSYFFGAFVACLVKRTLNATRAAGPAAVVAQPAPKAEPRPVPVSAPARVAAPVALKPHTYEPIQPKIDILPRPEPRPAPVPLDTARFDRALAGAQLPDTTPRKMIVEIRPQCLKPVTQRGGPPDRSLDKPKPVPAVAKPVAAAPAAAQPAAPEPKVPAQSSTPIVTKPQPVVPPAAAAAKPASQPPPAPAGQASSTAAAAASAAALAAGKSAASPPANPQVATPAATQPQKAPQVTPPPAAQPAAPAKPLATGSDDFLRIRAIDEAVASKLHNIGVKSFEDMARWTPADIARVTQMLSLAGRIEREQWVEQAQILAKGGETYYSRNRASMLQQPPAPSPADVAKPSAPVAPAQATAAPAPVTKPMAPPAQPVSQATVTPAAPPKAAPTPSPSPASSPAPSMPPQQPAAPPAPAMAPGVASAAAAAAAAAAALSGRSSGAPAPQPPAKPAAPAVQSSPPVQAAAPAAAKPAAPAPSAPATPAAPPAAIPAAANPTPAAAPQAPALSAAEALAQRTPAQMAAAAAAAFAAASASVTRGIRPIEPLSPLSKADPNVLHPARLVDAIKEKENKEQDGKEPRDADGLRSVRSPGLISSTAPEEFDDLKRIRGIGVLIEKRLNSLGVASYEQIAKWTASDVDRVSEQLDFKGRIERENWIEQARILASGGHTEFSRRVDKGEVDSSKA